MKERQIEKEKEKIEQKIEKQNKIKKEVKEKERHCVGVTKKKIVNEQMKKREKRK